MGFEDSKSHTSPSLCLGLSCLSVCPSISSPLPLFLLLVNRMLAVSYCPVPRPPAAMLLGTMIVWPSEAVDVFPEQAASALLSQQQESEPDSVRQSDSS